MEKRRRKRKLVSLYLTERELAAVDAVCEPYERNRWLREAIREKLARDPQYQVTMYEALTSGATVTFEHIGHDPDEGPYQGSPLSEPVP